ncbi:hypothetical protein [Streptomyces sp. NPDC054794]
MDLLSPHECCCPEGPRLTTDSEKALERRNLRVQFFRTALCLCLAVLAVALGGSPLIGARLLLLLSPPSGFGFQLALLLALHLGPDADETSRATTHVLQALPRTLAAERPFGCPHNQL